MSKWEHRAWRKLYIYEGPAFRQLPLMCRGLARELLALVDDGGGFEVGDRDTADVIARISGATSSDRRLLRRFVPLLFEVGYLVRIETRVEIRGFMAAQARLRKGIPVPPPVALADCGARADDEPDANPTRTEHEPARAEHEPITNPSRIDLEPRTRASATIGGHTGQNAPDTPGDFRESIRSESIRSDEIPGGDKSTPPGPTPKRRGRPPTQATRIPPDWRPGASTLEACLREGLGDPMAALPEFVDFWQAVPGAKGVKADWDAAFRNRLRMLHARRGGENVRPLFGPPAARAPAHKPIAPLSGAPKEAACKS